MEIISSILVLILIVSLSGSIKKILPFYIPLPLMQVTIGFLLAWPSFGLHINFDPELFLVLFIPPLLFFDGWKTSFHQFVYQGKEIIMLSLMLVAITIIGVGYLVYWMIPNIPLVAAIALAAVLSPTDAVALSSIVEEGQIPKKIIDILQGEALMNDASGLVSLKFAIKIAMGIIIFTTGSIFTEFMKVTIGGLIIGFATTWGYSKSLRYISRWSNDDTAIQTILLLLLPFAAYLFAENINVSGILAAVTSGIATGESRIIRNAPLTMRIRGKTIWTMLEFVFNGIVFILLGLQLPDILETTIAQVKFDKTITSYMLFFYIIIIYSALLILRFNLLWCMRYISNWYSTKKRLMIFKNYTMSEILIATFAGVRGSITLAGVLSIPLFIKDNIIFPSRYQLIFIATGVILLSLILSIIILPLLLCKNQFADKTLQRKEERTARTIAAEVAIESLYKMTERLANNREENIDNQILNEVSTKLISNLKHRIDSNNNDIENTILLENLERRMRLNALRAERGEYYHLRAQQKISNDILNKILNDLDLLEALLIEHKKK